MMNRHGKDGCIGCHAGKIVSALRTSGDPVKDFRILLKEGFLLPDDPGSLLSRITSRDSKRRMPPGDRPAWSNDEVATLRDFIRDLDRKQIP